MAYTEADVEQARVRVRNLIASQVVSMNEQEALEVLLAAALDGAKVPGMVADNAALEQALRSVVYVDCCGPVTGLGPRAHHAASSVLVSSSHGAALLAQHEAKVSALQAQVATLTAERDGARGRTGALERDLTNRGIELRNTRAERDALRAQVDPMREALEWIERETHPEDGATFERIHAKAAGALSAPPAETEHTFCGDPDCEGRSPAETTPMHCPKCDLDHPGPTNPCVLCEAHAAYSAEQFAKDDAAMAAEAKTTPATERKEWSTAEAPCTTCGASHAPHGNTLCPK